MKFIGTVEFLGSLTKAFKFLIVLFPHLLQMNLFLIFTALVISSSVAIVNINGSSPDFKIELHILCHFLSNLNFIMQMKVKQDNYLFVTRLKERVFDILQYNINFLIFHIIIAKSILVSTQFAKNFSTSQRRFYSYIIQN